VKYSKPELVVLGDATSLIQGMKPTGFDNVSDQTHNPISD
jgi:hypothetical protein